MIFVTFILLVACRIPRKELKQDNTVTFYIEYRSVNIMDQMTRVPRVKDWETLSNSSNISVRISFILIRFGCYRIVQVLPSTPRFLVDTPPPPPFPSLLFPLSLLPKYIWKLYICHCRADYLLVNGHHPVLSAGMHGNTNCLLDKTQAPLRRVWRHSIFQWHDHNLQVSRHAQFVSWFGVRLLTQHKSG